MFLLLPRSEVGGEGVWGGQDKVGGVLRDPPTRIHLHPGIARMMKFVRGMRGREYLGVHTHGPLLAGGCWTGEKMETLRFRLLSSLPSPYTLYVYVRERRG